MTTTTTTPTTTTTTTPTTVVVVEPGDALTLLPHDLGCELLPPPPRQRQGIHRSTQGGFSRLEAWVIDTEHGAFGYGPCIHPVPFSDLLLRMENPSHADQIIAAYLAAVLAGGLTEKINKKHLRWKNGKPIKRAADVLINIGIDLGKGPNSIVPQGHATYLAGYHTLADNYPLQDYPHELKLVVKDGWIPAGVVAELIGAGRLTVTPAPSP